MSKVKLIIAGGREFVDLDSLRIAFLSFVGFHDQNDVTIVSGTARGADKLGEQLAKEYGLPVIRMPADWTNKGRAAGHIRNAEMAAIGTHLLAAWDGKSKGTKGMIDVAKRKG